jgi:hypothetical protein
MQYIYFGIYTIFLYLFCQVSLLAQNSTLLAMYPNAKAICSKKSKELSLILQKDSLLCSAKYYTETLHLSTQSSNYANESVSFSQFHCIQNLKAYTILPNKKRIYVKDFLTKNVVGNNIFFDDLKEKTFVFPKICAGAKTVVEYEEIIQEPRLLGVYYFNSYLPIEFSEFTVKTSPEVKINYKVFGANQHKIMFHTYTQNNQIIYQWKVENVASFGNESNIARKVDDEPHIVVYIEEIKTQQNKIIPYLKTTADLYHWYYDLSKNILLEQNTYIKNLADSLTKNSQTDRQKARILYEWVQKNIRYVAFEDGLGGLVPRMPEEVCKKRYGDCKDMATLLLSLAKCAKVKAFLVWVGTRTIPYRYQDLPVPIVDNHLITAFYLDNSYVFADATADYLPFGLPSDFIQGKEGLLGLDSTKFEIVGIPISKAEKNIQFDSLYLKIDSNKIAGKGKINFTGYQIPKAKKIYYAVHQQQKSLWDTKNLTISIDNSSILANNLHEDIDTKNEQKYPNFVIKYACEAANLLKFSGTDIFINLHTNKKILTEKIDIAQRKTAIQIDFPYIQHDKIVLEFPAHWQTSFVPENRIFEHEKFSFSVNYTQIGNKIILEKKLIVRVCSIEKEDFWTWNMMLVELGKAYQETIGFYE